METKIIKKCEICKGKEFKFLFYGKDKLFNIPGTFPTYKCKNCGLIFIYPQPSEEELNKYYPKEKYYSLDKINTKEDSKRVRLRLFLYDVYFNQQKRGMKNLLMQMVFSPLKFTLSGTKIEKNKKLLDIGCGSGQFLYEMKEKGMEDVYGVEPGEFNVKEFKEKRLNILNSDLVRAKYQDNFFDTITMNHVLEHVGNPLKTIKEIHRILNKKGTFIVGVPNSRSLAYKIFKSNWFALESPRHLFNYSNKNLKQFLENNGFKVKKIRYNSRPTQFVASLYYLFGVKNPSEILFSSKAKIVNNLLKGIFLPLTWIVNILKWGDQIEIWAEKNE